MKIACIVSKFPKAVKLYQELQLKYTFYKVEQADVIICLGGDGFMLHSLHKLHKYDKPIYGINCGSIGFLLNRFNNEESLENILKNSVAVDLFPLIASITNCDDTITNCIAFNEVSLLRNAPTASHLSLSIDEITRVNKMVADGILVATPVGSTAYNMACGGKPIPLYSNMLAITPINVFSPLNWRGAVISNNHTIKISNLDTNTRSVNLFCDFKEFKNIKSVNITTAKEKVATLLFDGLDSLENRIIKAQFAQV